MDDVSVEKVFNAVDERTALQKQLHTLVCEGFMWLSRECYRDSLATHRKCLAFTKYASLNTHTDVGFFFSFNNL